MHDAHASGRKSSLPHVRQGAPIHSMCSSRMQVYLAAHFLHKSMPPQKQCELTIHLPSEVFWLYPPQVALIPGQDQSVHCVLEVDSAVCQS